MESKRRHRITLPSAHVVCPSCKQPVDTVVVRHKTMGINVPLWTTGPCRNPDCEQYEPEDTAEEPLDAPRPQAPT